MLPSLTTARILTMEWVDGERLTETGGDLGLVSIGVQCSLEQLLDYGYFHADPHLGNLFKTRDGRLGELARPRSREKLTGARGFFPHRSLAP